MSCQHENTYAVDTHNRIDCIDCDASWEGQEIVKMEKALKEAIEIAKYIQQACLCDSRHSKSSGFDYNEEHPRMGKSPEVGSRWISPRDRVNTFLTKWERGQGK